VHRKLIDVLRADAAPDKGLSDIFVLTNA
jgi:hypothetical protein